MRKFFHSKYFYASAVLLTIVAGALFLLWPMLSGKFIFPSTFIGLAHYMYFTVTHHFVYDLGILPNWWPAYNSGYPISLTLDGFLNPIFILTLKFLPPFLANNIIIFVFFVLNGLSLYALCRALKLSRLGSLIAAISYAFSGVIIQHTPVTSINTLMLFLPLSFLCCLKIFQGRTKWFWLWLPLLIYSWIGGWSEMIVYALVASGFFAIYLFIKNRKSENFSYRPLILFFGAVVLSVIILLPWFLSVLHFVSFSNRSGGVNLEVAGGLPNGLSELIHVFYPHLFVFYGEILPYIPIFADFHLYIGTLPLLLVLASLFIKNKKGKEYLIFFLALAAGSILMTINRSPLFWLFHQIPVLKWFGGYWKWNFIIVFSLAILAGYGMDNIRDFFRNRSSKYIISALWILMLAALIGVAIITAFDKKIETAITSYGLSNYENTPDRAFSRSERYYNNIIKEISTSFVNNFSFKNNFVILTMGLWLVALIYFTLGKFGYPSYERWRIPAVAITWLGSVLIWNGTINNGLPAWYLKTPPDTAKYLYSINPYASDKLPINAENSQILKPYRIFLYTPDQFVAVLSEKYEIDFQKLESRQWFIREMMDNNTNIMFNFDAFVNHQTLASRRLWNLYYAARQQKEFVYNDPAPFEEYIKTFSGEKNLHLLGALNIKYILTPFKLINELQPIFTSYILEGKFPVYIYENPYFMPRWYFANNIKWTEQDDKIALEDMKTINDFEKTTLLEKITLNNPAIATKADPKDKMELQLYTAGKLILKTNTKNYRFLVFSESRQPFWQATVNGADVPLYVANYLWQAVLVPPGENTVEFRYPNLWEQSVISGQSYIDKFLNKIK